MERKWSSRRTSLPGVSRQTPKIRNPTVWALQFWACRVPACQGRWSHQLVEHGHGSADVQKSDCTWASVAMPLGSHMETIEESDRDPQNPSRTQKAKARLVVLGYLDPKITEIPRDSPTLNRHSKMLLLQLIASKSWTLRSFDVKAAFLQGRPQSDRILGLEPVPELATKMNLRPDEICGLPKVRTASSTHPFCGFRHWKINFRF